MNKPFISGITLAYGCKDRLEEAIQCFLNQDYDGPKELVVLNTAPQQTLSGSFPNVRIINLRVRPTSLGQARNVAVMQALGTFIITCDSDDHYLPGHFRAYANALMKHPDAQWVRFAPTFFAEKWTIKHTFNGWANAVGFSKAAHQMIGGYSNALSVGEDRQFIGKLSAACRGVTMLLKPDQITAIYNWDTGTYHISGMGDDKKGRAPAYERSRIDFETRLRQKREPTGKVELTPHLEHDPEHMVSVYLARPQTKIPKDAVALVYVGRFGDITNVLPIALHINNTYGKPYFVCGREFAEVLDGVSYVTPFPVHLRSDQINEAMDIARRHFTHVIQCQIWGKDYKQERLTDAYNKESWRIAGFLNQFDNPAWVPVFDQRDKEEEKKLCQKANPEDLPLILVNVTRGISSPFKDGQRLLEHIRQKYGRGRMILDVGSLRARKIYDLLGLIEYAWAVVTIDTSLLHLAAAATTPTLALVNPVPWQATAPRFSHCVCLPYDRLGAGEGFEDFDAAMERVLGLAKPPSLPKVPVLTAPIRRVFHALERHEDSPSEKRRKEPAVRSWEVLYKTGVVPCHYREYKRTADKTIGDPRRLPYLKDVLAFAMQDAKDNDIIMWTNDDNVLHPDVASVVRLHCAVWGCVTSHRVEFRGPLPSMNMRPSEVAARGHFHMGRDLIAFEKRFLMEHWEKIPDFILGASDFDLCIAAWVRLRWGIKSTRLNMEHPMWPAELHRGYVAHRYHPPKWNAPANKDTAPSQIWNRRLFREWADTHLPELQFGVNNTI